MLFGTEMSGTILGKLYSDLKNILDEIHSRNRQRSENRLIHLVERYL